MGSPIQDLNVQLYRDNTLLFKGKTDRLGKIFLLLDSNKNNSIKTGHLSYESKLITLPPTDRKQLVFKLIKKSRLLQTVEIEGVRVKHDADRTSYLIDQNKFSENNNSLDVLKRLSGISVINSEIMVLGQKNIAYYYDGKEVDFDFIKLLSAKSIKKIEVLDQNVKYKEGKYIIINIIPRSMLDGYAATIGQAVGTRHRITSQGALKLKKNKFIFDSNILFSSYKNPGSHSSQIFTEKDIEELYNGSRSTSFKNVNFSANALFNIDTLNSISLYSNILHSPTKNQIITHVFDRDLFDIINSFNKSSYNLMSTTLDYRKKISDRTSFNSSFYIKSESLDDKFDIKRADIEYNSNHITKQDLIFQVNYTSQIGSSFQWNAGSKYVKRQNTNRFNNGKDFINQNQKENIYYLLAEGILKSSWVNTTASLNLELYDGLLKNDLEQDRKMNYNNLFYSLILSKKIGKTNFLRLNLSRLIYRPSMNMLSMFYNDQDINVIKIGNSKLNPEIQNSARVSFNKTVGLFDINLSNSFKITTDEMSPYYIENDNLTTRQFINIRKKISFIPSIDISFQKGSFYNQLGVSYEIYRYRGIDSLTSNPNRTFGNLLFTNSLGFSFQKNWSIDASVMYESGLNTFQSKTKGYTYGDISLNKEIKKIRFTLEYLDIFNKSSNFINTLYLSRKFQQKTIYSSNVLRFKITYSFGKEFNVSNFNNIKNQDVKDIK